MINNLNKELKKIELSSDVNAVSEETKLKARMAMAEEKKKQAEEQQARFLEIQKAKEAEFEANAKRSEAQINKINELSRNANVKIKELRQLKKDSASVLGFLNQIESKKAAIVQIDEDVVSEQKEIANKIKQDYKIKIDEIEEQLPGIDCASCGSPSCACFAQDVAMGNSKLNDCVFIMKKELLGEK